MRPLPIALVALWLLPATALGAPSFAGRPTKVAGVTLAARVQGDRIAFATGRGFAPRFWPGVNLGATVPGRQPGEVAATRADYDRWLRGMGVLGPVEAPRRWSRGSPPGSTASPRSRPPAAGAVPSRSRTG